MTELSKSKTKWLMNQHRQRLPPAVVTPGPAHGHNRHSRRETESMQRDMARAFKKIPGATKQTIGKELTTLAYRAWHAGLITDMQLRLFWGKP